MALYTDWFEAVRVARQNNRHNLPLRCPLLVVVDGPEPDTWAVMTDVEADEEGFLGVTYF